MKKMRQSFSILTVLFAFCLVFALSVKVDAAETKAEAVNIENCEVTPMVTNITKANFVLGTYSSFVSSSNILRVAGYAPADANYMDAALFDKDGNVLNTARAYVNPYGNYSFSTSFSGLAKNKVYYVSCRTLQIINGQQIAGTWTEKRAVTFLKCSAKTQRKSSYKTIKVKGPKVKGMKKYKVQVSKKRDSGYKTVKNLKPGKSYTISKFKGKKLKRSVTYYIRIVPVTSSGISSDIVALFRY